MNLSKLAIGTITLAVLAMNGHALAKESDEGATAKEKSFIMKAANGGMTEVELGRIAGEKGASEKVKDFGAKMVTEK